MVQFDLIIVGTGSGNSIIGPEMDDWRIAIAEKGLFGGTCLNVGCIPTKMLVYPADVAHHAADSERLGVHGRVDGVEWPAIRDRIFGRIDPIAESGRQYRHSLPNVAVHEGVGRFVAPKVLEVNGERLTAAQIVIAAGGRPYVPTIPGLGSVPFHTSDTIMRIDRLPEHLVIIGGGFIAAEFAHVFSSFGSRVTIVNRSLSLLQAEDHDIAARFTALAERRWELVLGAGVAEVRGGDGEIEVEAVLADGPRAVRGDALLVAMGRIPNSDLLDAAAGGLELDRRGNITVDEYGRTNVSGVWALGDINGRHQLKHMANGEARVIRHNLSHPGDLRRLDDRPAPHAVFSHPQIGAVGLTEEQASATGEPYCVVTHDYAGAAYGWAMEDTTSFCKLIGDPRTRQLIGAHVIGPQASMLVQQLVQGMHLGTTVDDLAHGQVWIHPALNEVNEVALLKLIEAFDTGAAVM